MHFLVGDQSSFITGAVWSVNGGDGHVSSERRAALVTGPVGGIGAAIAARLERDDWSVLTVVTG